MNKFIYKGYEKVIDKRTKNTVIGQSKDIIAWKGTMQNLYTHFWKIDEAPVFTEVELDAFEKRMVDLKKEEN